MKFRKKPVVIEAVQHFKNDERTLEIPDWLVQANVDGTVFAYNGETYILTKEGKMHVSDGDWIIRGVKGELYPCKPDIFSATYEDV